MKIIDQRIIFQAVVDCVIIVMELVGLAISTKDNGLWQQFVFYTQNSNYILMFASIFHLISILKNGEPSRAASAAQYGAVCLTTVTLLVVIFLLAPMYRTLSGVLFGGSKFIMHLAAPLLALTVYLAVPVFKPSKVDFLTAIVPTVIYAAVLIVLNVVRAVEGPYPFLKVWEQPWYMSVMWAVLIVGSAAAIAAVLRLINLRR